MSRPFRRTTLARLGKSNGSTKPFCHLCSSIRLHEYGSTDSSKPTPFIGQEIISLGTLKDLIKRSDCPLCGLVGELLRQHPDLSRDIENPHGVASKICFLNPNYSTSRFAIICGDHTRERIRGWVELSSDGSPPKNASAILSHSCGAGGRTLPGNGTTVIDPQQVRKWLNDCLNKHTFCSVHGSQTDFDMYSDDDEIYLVDVLQGRIVKRRTNDRYMTLSYVWGGYKGLELTEDHFWFLQQETSSSLKIKPDLVPVDINNINYQDPPLYCLKNHLPAVLFDSMELVRSMGERFLWCDAVCIPQTEKHGQIKMMDLIYSRSILTIVALSGTNSTQSLPGIRSSTRGSAAKQRQTGNMRIVARSPTLKYITEGSIYATRAWTFQENMLSQRCLYLSDWQCFFQCGAGIFREDETLSLIPTALTDDSSDDHDLFRLVNNAAQLQQQNDIFRAYAALVNAYTARGLTFESDAIYAFQGLMGLLKRKYNVDHFYSALPRFCMEDALLWRPCQPLERRETFPSWSWAGWRGQVVYASSVTPINGNKPFLDAKKPIIVSTQGSEPHDPTNNFDIKQHNTHSILELATQNHSEVFSFPYEPGFYHEKHDFRHVAHVPFDMSIWFKQREAIAETLAAYLLALWTHAKERGEIDLSTPCGERLSEADARSFRNLMEHSINMIPCASLNSHIHLDLSLCFKRQHLEGIRDFNTPGHNYLMESLALPKLFRAMIQQRGNYPFEFTFIPFEEALSKYLPRCGHIWSYLTNEQPPSVAAIRRILGHFSIPSPMPHGFGQSGVDVGPSEITELIFCARSFVCPADSIRQGQLFMPIPEKPTYLVTEDGRHEGNPETRSVQSHPTAQVGTWLRESAANKKQPATLVFLPGTKQACGMLYDYEDSILTRMKDKKCQLVVMSRRKSTEDPLTYAPYWGVADDKITFFKGRQMLDVMLLTTVTEIDEGQLLLHHERIASGFLSFHVYHDDPSEALQRDLLDHYRWFYLR